MEERDGLGAYRLGTLRPSCLKGSHLLQSLVHYTSMLPRLSVHTNIAKVRHTRYLSCKISANARAEHSTRPECVCVSTAN
jgi:hypothetical protein